MITQEILIDVNNRIAPEVVSRLGESNVRQLLIKPVYFNPDGTYTQIVIDSENVHGMFRMVKPDGTFVTTNIALATPSSEPAVFIVTLTGSMSQVAGRGYYDVRIGDTEDASEFIYSAQGLFTIDDDMLTDEMIESVAEANGFVFPDDFLTSADLEDYVTDDELSDTLDDYATKTYVDDAIAEIDVNHVYSTTAKKVGTWIDGKDIMEIVFTGSFSITSSGLTINETIPYGCTVLSAQAVNVSGHGDGGAVSCAPLVVMESNGNSNFTVYSSWNWAVSARFIVIQYIAP